MNVSNAATVSLHTLNTTIELARQRVHGEIFDCYRDSGIDAGIRYVLPACGRLLNQSIKMPRYSHPYFWASFILIGDWR
jgi:CHAT domain-containing protein